MEPVDVDVDVDVDYKAEWSTRNDVIFILILHEHVKKGDLQTSTFHKRVWSTIGDELFQQTKKRFTVLRLKSKFNRLRKKQREFSNLITHTRFETGQLSFSSSQVHLPSDEDREVEDNFINSGVHVNVIVENGDDDDDGVELTKVSNKKKGKRDRRSIGSSTNRRKNKWESMDTYFETAKEVMQVNMNYNNQSDSSDNESELEAEQQELEALELASALRRAEYYQYIDKMPCYTCGLTWYAFVQELLKEQSQLLEDDRHVTVLEAVGICLYILPHVAVMQVVAERFQRSKDMVYRQVKRVLKGLCGLAPNIIPEQTRGQQPPPLEIRNNPKFYPYFKNCIGAIDGTHISACVPAHKQNSYRDRKVQVTQNVMRVCSFDMMFIFVYTGWEGTANDSRVILDAIGRQENSFPHPNEGYYYVVDSGYINMPGFSTPYRGERYHLRDYEGQERAPRDPNELFNYRHSSLRNVIERCFGVLKK
ncbi:hypothetical protein Dsin_015029 [Dipteronia sinensis]|uniref:Transposase n=1 Tax=Dipteronia sinensis TaxID=43782 RepID=A0AAE0AP46_9ROSI|nr:hypothetical protein Dsin_015029 [Dipteronia sinensis]